MKHLLTLVIAVLIPALCWGQDELNSESGLVGRWLVPGWQTGNGAVPTKALDVGGKTGASTISNLATWATSSSRQSLLLNGTNQLIYVTNAAILKTLTQSSVMMWVNTTNFSMYNTKYRAFYGESISGGVCYAAVVNTNTYPYFYINSDAGDNNCTSKVKITSGKWTHIACTFNKTGNGMKIYVDGIQTGLNTNKLITTNDVLATYIAAQNFRLTNYSYYNGYIYDVRAYNRELSSSEIKSIYEQGLAPK